MHYFSGIKYFAPCVGTSCMWLQMIIIWNNSYEKICIFRRKDICLQNGLLNEWLPSKMTTLPNSQGKNESRASKSTWYWLIWFYWWLILNCDEPEVVRPWITDLSMAWIHRGSTCSFSTLRVQRILGLQISPTAHRFLDWRHRLILFKRSRTDLFEVDEFS